MGHADESVMNQVDSAIAVSFGLPNTTHPEIFKI